MVRESEASARSSMNGEALLSLELAGIRMDVRADPGCRSGLDRLARAWAACRASETGKTPRAVISASLDQRNGDVVIEAGPLIERGEFAPEECHLAMERGLYAELTRLLPANHQVLHAGAVVQGSRGVLLVGPSGAGKSSLTLAACARGARYMSDDIVTTDGAVVRGLARAIQFDPPHAEKEFPAWLKAASLDYETYPRLSKEQDNSAPLFTPKREDVAASARADCFSTVVLSRGEETQLVPMAPPDALAELIGSAFHREKRVDLGALVRQRAYRLTWAEPHLAWAKIEEVL